MSTLTLFLCAGEASGDVHGANLMKALKKVQPDIRFVGVGGPKMRAEGIESFIHAEKLSVIGLVEVLKNIKFFKKTLDMLTLKMIELNVDAFIPIDFPDFNLRLAKRAHNKKIKTIYYICPQVWAWRKGRIKDIENIIDFLITIFPFEAGYFDESKLKVSYIGHPLLDEVDVKEESNAVEKGKGKLVIMPGSRHSEIDHHMPTLVEFIEKFHNKYPEVTLHIPCAQTLRLEELYRFFSTNMRQSLKKNLVIHEQGKSSEVLKEGDAALIASGTSTLQGVLCNIPCSIFYKLNKFTYMIGKRLIKLPYVSLVNLVAEKEVVREHIQDEMNVESLMEYSEKLLWDEEYRKSVYDDYASIRQKLGGKGASDRAAEEIVEFLK